MIHDFISHIPEWVLMTAAIFWVGTALIILADWLADCKPSFILITFPVLIIACTLWPIFCGFLVLSWVYGERFGKKDDLEGHHRVERD